MKSRSITIFQEEEVSKNSYGFTTAFACQTPAHYNLVVPKFRRSVFQVLAFIFQHEAICEFPSNTFYDGKLQTAEVVKNRKPNPITFWPAMVSQKNDIPIVFCHVEGQEESTPIASPESNQESKWNQKEVLKTVCIFACYH